MLPWSASLGTISQNHPPITTIESVTELPALIAAEPVWRRPGELQVSTAHGPLVLQPVPAGLYDAVGLFDGHHDDRDLVDLIGTAWSAWLMDRLISQDAFAAEAVDRLVCQIRGDGPLAQRLASGLRSLGHDVLPNPSSATQPDVVILANGMVEADRILASQLTQANRPHLIVTVNQTTAQVGPFVTPATTSCLGCLDRVRQALDPAWGLMVFQRMRLTSTPDPVLAAWAVATTLAHLRAYGRGVLPESASTTLTLDRSGTVTYTAWPRHPDCDQHQSPADFPDGVD